MTLDQDTPQYMTALNEANRVRLARAKLRREVYRLPPTEARARLEDIISRPPDFVLTALVQDVLEWQWNVGPSRALSMMRACSVASVKTVGELTDRQRTDLGRCLRGLEALVLEEAEDRLLQAVTGRAQPAPKRWAA